MHILKNTYFLERITTTVSFAIIMVRKICTPKRTSCVYAAFNLYFFCTMETVTRMNEQKKTRCKNEDILFWETVMIANVE